MPYIKHIHSIIEVPMFASMLLYVFWGCSSNTELSEEQKDFISEEIERQLKKKERISNKRYKKMRSEVPSNLKAIKTAQIAYESDFDTYVTCSPYPSRPSSTPKKWTPSASGGFKTIGWRPDGDVRGSYSVTTSSTDFTAVGIIDVDGDGVYATFVATKSENANAPTTPNNVY